MCVHCRSVFQGRSSFSGRSVIAGNWKLRNDEIILPYQSCVELLQQRIVNILRRRYSISYADAYNIWQRGQLVVDDRIVSIINDIINTNKGFPLLMNRPPTISYGSILYMRCIGMSFNYTMQVPLGILNLIAGDFDGDVLSLLAIINEDFRIECNKVLNPRNAFYISKNDGKVDSGMLPFKDLIININSLVHESRKNYSDEQIEKILKLKQMVA